MRVKPFYLHILPLILLGIIVSFPLQIHLLYQIPLSDMTRILSMLTPINFLCMFCLMISAMLIASLNRFIYIMAPTLIALVTVNNLIVAYYGQDFSIEQVIFSAALFTSIHLPLYKKEFRQLILTPELRWWLTPKRFEIKKEISVLAGSGEHNMNTVNVSQTGLLTVMEDDIPYKIDDIIKIKIDAIAPITLDARVVRKTNINDQVGMGLELVQNENFSSKYLPWFKETTAYIY